MAIDEQESGKSGVNKGSGNAPAISLPKGGGAIRGIGEKFSANPVTGTGSVSVPIVTTPGRSGFGPRLSLSYDSGAGNGVFGLGWSLSLPNISRKTDKGLPEYIDDVESDVFMLSGVEDLVRVLSMSPGGQWIPEVLPSRTVNGAAYRIQRYRPRIEGLFSRIERWSNEAAPQDVFWRSISKDNVTTWYGRTANSRVADPANPSRIFKWLLCESYDDKGNVIAYQYKQENSDNLDLSQCHERNRTEDTRGANRHLKHIRYGNRDPYLPELTPATGWPALPAAAGWYFELVFDYGEHDHAAPTPDGEVNKWATRPDPFSFYRPGFEVRTYRLCQRVLMFHRFPELGITPCLVASTDFVHQPSSLASYLEKVLQRGYTRDSAGVYLQRSMPPVEFSYSQAKVDESTKVRSFDIDSRVNLPEGVDGQRHAFVDLNGEGLSGILTKQGLGWFYKDNLSPITQIEENDRNLTVAHFGPAQLVATIPFLQGQQFLDLAGDGTLDAVSFQGPTPGFFERTSNDTWESFVPFRFLPNVDWNDSNLRFIDLTGDGHADIAITEEDVLVWYRSLEEDGFGPGEKIRLELDDEKGPKIIFGDSEQSIFLADMSGDGLTDIVRVKFGEVCYWPNRGYGRFGTKVTMDNIPRFDSSERFDAARIRMADIDGSGVVDIIYLAPDGPDLYFNQSGNRWSESTKLTQCPTIDNLSSVVTVDLLSNGTACLVWSSPLPAHANEPLRYIRLMEEKPHLLTGLNNNLGAETRVAYAPSTKFYLADQQAGTPWVTRIPFPVHVVERVETYDWISRNRFVTRYAYHHGYFDGEEREFRGFGMIEQSDTEEFATLTVLGELPAGDNIADASHVPPIRTKTWFHTGAFLEGEKCSLQFAREYFGAPQPGAPNYEAKFVTFLKTLLPDTVPTTGLTAVEEREAYRALKGAMLRQEVYAEDGSLKSATPYTASEHSYTIELVQPAADNRNAVFFTHSREAISYHYERNVVDPRVGHELILKVDGFGNVERSLAIGYPRRTPLPGIPEQGYTHMTLTVSRVVNHPAEADWYRVGLPVEARTFEVVKPLQPPVGRDSVLKFDDLKALIETMFPLGQDAPTSSQVTPYEDWGWRDTWNPAVDPGGSGISRLRLIEHVRTLYRKDDLSGLLLLGQMESLALPYESYKLALTPPLLTEVYGARVTNAMLTNEGRYVHSEGDVNWWIPSGRVFYSSVSNDTAAQELAQARQHFFLPCRYRDPFHTAVINTESLVRYDVHDLFPVETTDAAGNKVTAELDYRVLQARLVTDPNGNRMEAAFDTLGLVAGTAIMGKTTESLGDTLAGFAADLTATQTVGFFDSADPHLPAPGFLKEATTRILYDVERFSRSQQANPKDASKWEPVVSATLARETHSSDPLPAQGLKIQIIFSHSDGFGREIQKKIQAEPGPIVENGPLVDPRWVGSGWTIFNNKGNPIRQYEPFFSSTHRFEFATITGVSPVLLYDPVGRVVATLHPNHTFEKILFDPWQQVSWDVNDTLTLNPKTDPDVSGYFTRLPDAEYLPTWFQTMSASADVDERNAAQRTKAHDSTPAIAHFDSLGRVALAIADNGALGNFETRTELDIEGNQRSVTDALGRIAMRYDYDMLSNRIHQTSMEAGTRWMLIDVAGNLIRVWNDRGFIRQMTYDMLRRRREVFVTDSGGKRLATLTTYGEGKPTPESTNHRGRVWQVRDDAGIVTSVKYDFKGNLLSGDRDLRSDYKTPVNWALTPTPATSEMFHSSTKFDALNRVLESASPDGSITIPTYNEASLLEAVNVRLRGAPLLTSFVRNIDYDAKGQRTRLEYNHNGAPFLTTYTYDRETFRLTRLFTLRPNHADVAKRILQDLHYTFDPKGNITHIKDDAQQTIYFRNQRVKPSNNYTYDAIYRLIEARGREHMGQSAAPTPADPFNTFHANQSHPGDGNMMGTYIENFTYDAVGNVRSVKHQRTDLASPGWTRVYDYNESSLIEPSKHSNRLSRTVVVGNVPSNEFYKYDAHGNMVSMHLPVLSWNSEDQLSEVDLQGGGKAYYVYNAVGQRVRKVVERLGSTVEDRIYLGDYEIHRQRVAGALALERETLHVMDDIHRIALVETHTQGIGGAPAHLIRFQLGNHLGSAAVEVDEAAQIISYEEYFPYGSTSYQAVDATREVPRKRYRYTGKERDEETGLNYHEARYYAPWLGRWTSSDPIGLGDGVNLYRYVSCNPAIITDSTGTQEDNAHTTAFVANKPAIVSSDDWLKYLGTVSNDCYLTNTDLDKFKPIDPPTKPEGTKRPLKVNVSGQVLDTAKAKWNEPNATVATKAATVFSVGMMAGLYGFEMVANIPDLFESSGEELALSHYDPAYSGTHLLRSGRNFGEGLASLSPFGEWKGSSLLRWESSTASSPAAGLLPRTLQLNLVPSANQANVLRTLRAIGTDEALATSKLISRGEVQLEFVPGKDPFGPHVAGLQPFGTNKAQIALDKLPSTNKELAGLVGHEAFHVVQGITRENYTLTHELEAFTWQAGITGEVNQANQLEWMEQKYQSLLQEKLVYPQVRRY
jgi:RHS repeat-associated protein